MSSQLLTGSSIGRGVDKRRLTLGWELCIFVAICIQHSHKVISFGIQSGLQFYSALELDRVCIVLICI